MKNLETKSNKVSLKEIARLSGVSIATVSRVINNTGRFSEETKHRVLNIVKKNNYRTNTLARSLRTKHSNSIGILVPDLTNDFFSKVVQEIEKNLFKVGYSTIICDTQRDPDMENYYLNTLEAKAIDALIVISGDHPFDSDSLTEKVPVLCIDRKPKNKDTIFISSNHKTGALIATQRLIDKGYFPVYVSPDHVSTSRASRISGFKHALELNSIQFTQSNSLELKAPNQESYDKTIEEFLQKNQDKRLGLFCLSDYIAAIAIRQIHKLNLKIPNEIGVIGFDDTKYASLLNPSLTTIHQDTSKIAELSAKIITKMISSSNTDIKKNIEVPVTLVARESA